MLGCPYEGPVSPERVASLAERLHELSCDEIPFGDTIGAGTPLAACRVVEATAHWVPLGCIAVYFHDTPRPALANLLACLGLEGSIIDAVVAGLGGCPYAPGASGNVATEERRAARGFGYYIFGELVEAIDAVDQIRTVPTRSRGPHEGVPVPRSRSRAQGRSPMSRQPPRVPQPPAP